MFYKMILVILVCVLAGSLMAQIDPYLWLEDIDGAKALEWVSGRNAETLAELQQEAGFQALNERTLKILDSRERIAYPSIQGSFLYNFWQDAGHERGIWRRTTLVQYRLANPVWETVLDLDALSAQEGQKWVFKGAGMLYPDFKRCLVRLSRGGGDAVEIREFDLENKSFVKDGFFLPEAKTQVDWLDRNTLVVGTDFGPGSLTSSGYARISKIWRRGSPLSAARTIFEGLETDITAATWVLDTPERQYVLLVRNPSFFSTELFALENGQKIKIEIPEDAQLAGIFKNQMLVELKTDWSVGGKTYRQGALLAIDYDRFLAGERKFAVIEQPDDRSSIVSVSSTQNHLLVLKLNHVRGMLFAYTFTEGRFQGTRVDAPDMGNIRVQSTDDFSDRYFISYSDFLTPTTLYLGMAGQPGLEKLKSLPAFFDASDHQAAQYEAVSADGTKIPYFIVHPKSMAFDGANPTLLSGYGGFEVSEVPFYSGTMGSGWLEKGGVYVLANIRGGGEFGPKWHLSALKENRQRAFDDFIAVAEDLIRRKVTSPRHLGIEGGSNGGLLVGVMLTQRPDLFNAIVCAVPLLDMQRYNKLLAGASWMAEYGDPDKPEEWAYISKYSPYQNMAAGKPYPPVYFTTSTRDDRVHPGHARKMVAKMQDLGYKVYYFENTEGGHSSGSTNKIRALSATLSYMYLWKQLKR